MICEICEEKIYEDECYELDGNACSTHYICKDCMREQIHQLYVHTDSPVTDFLIDYLEEFRTTTPEEGWAIDPDH